MKAIIIEDEINVREGFVKLLQVFCPEISIVGTAENVEGGLSIINENEFDLLFLDINLPDGSGFDLMHRVTNRQFKLIFVTAYDKYAIDAFKLNAIDYLLKPVSPDLLIKAIGKVRDVHNPMLEKEKMISLEEHHLDRTNQANKIILKDQDSLHLIQIKEIIFCEAEGSYTCFTLENGNRIVTSMNLKEYEQLLLPFNFLRSHHSFLVNLNHVVELKKQDGGFLIMSNGSKLSISTRKKAAIIEGIKRIFIN